VDCFKWGPRGYVPTKRKFNTCWVYFGYIANFIKSFISIYSIKTIKS